MKVVGSIIARLQSKRLRYKNLLPFNQMPLIGNGIEILKKAKKVDCIVVSTESELIARIASEYNVYVLKRPEELAEDNIPSVPVFQHVIQHFPCDIHVNFNINFPLCHPDVIDKAVGIAHEHGESLSVPFAAWAQTSKCLNNYIDPWNITAKQFSDERAGEIDVHSEEDLLNIYREKQGELKGWEANGLILPSKA